MPNGIGYDPPPVVPERLAGLIASHPVNANGQIAVERPGLCGKPHRDYPHAMRLCLFEPEIAGNVGAVMRLGACMGVAVDLIEPMGFEWDDRRVRRTAMDYIDHVDVTRHASFDAFRAITPGRLVLFTTKGDSSPYVFSFEPNDILLFGKESGGVTPDIAGACDAKLKLPICAEVRSFNLATAAAIALGEALRQTDGLPA
ncbi:MAG TPA: tRNA (cytidine(34)-2'-O)-methyltransferase [Devosiaceae bacterium]|jgi:tRNA (cytidine/uridine-2'-O-)-methyltransferase|nr:tRNA (cytidine(34)-2'-O)-methyltransferase [Devosiaceae bacterium]